MGIIYYNAGLGQFMTAPGNSIPATNSVSIAPASMLYYSHVADSNNNIKQGVYLSNATDFYVVDASLSLSSGKALRLAYDDEATALDQGCSIGYGLAPGTSNLDIVGYNGDSNNSSNNNTRHVKVWDDLEVNGNVLVRGDLSLTSTSNPWLTRSPRAFTVSPLLGMNTVITTNPFMLYANKYDDYIYFYNGQPMPLGVSGWGNDASYKHAFVEACGFINVKPYDLVPPGPVGVVVPHPQLPYKVTSVFRMQYYTVSPIDESTTTFPLLTESGSVAHLRITSFNGTQGGLARGVSDTFLFPAAHQGDDSIRIFLSMVAVDANTQTLGFYIANASLHCF